jgi:hypothetical protein
MTKKNNGIHWSQYAKEHQKEARKESENDILQVPVGEFFKGYDFVGSSTEQRGKTIAVYARKSPCCGICANWEGNKDRAWPTKMGECNSEERQRMLDLEAQKKYGTTDKVNSLVMSSYGYKCTFFRRKERTGE